MGLFGLDKRGLLGVLMVALQLLWQPIASCRGALLPAPSQPTTRDAKSEPCSEISLFQLI